MIDKFNNKSNVLETLFNLLDCHVYWKNKQGQYLWCNKKFARVLGLKNENAIIGKTDYDLFASELAEEVVTLDKTILNKGIEHQIEEIGFDSKNRKAIYLSIKTPLKDELGKINGLIGISINITDRKQSEIAKQEFLMNMAHDLRTPLSGIIALSNIQSKEGTSAEDRIYSQWIKGAGEQLLELLNSVLEVTAAEHPMKSLARDIIDFQQFAKELQALMKPAIIDKRLEFEIKLDRHLPRVITDGIKLKRIILNLLSNAVKFTKHGKIGLHISALIVKKNEAKIAILISDTGIGMAAHQLDKIFDRFYRVHPSYQAEYKGYGIGLFLVKKSVELLGGAIKVTSKEGKGSCFTVTFNFPLAEEGMSKKSQQSLSKPNNDKQSQKILVAEDDTLALYAAKKLLFNLGYEVTTVTTGKAALKGLKTQAFRWALLDIGLPDLDGVEIVRRYRQWEQKNEKAHLPIFSLTAHMEKNIMEKCKAVGFDYVLNKPFTEKDIHIIQKFLDK